MSIRDENLSWKSEAITFSNDLKPLLKDNLKKAKEQGFGFEDWFYLIVTEANEIIMEIALGEEMGYNDKL